MFSLWEGGDLSSGLAWGYAVRGQGQDVINPWGDDDPTLIFLIIWIVAM